MLPISTIESSGRNLKISAISLMEIIAWSYFQKIKEIQPQ